MSVFRKNLYPEYRMSRNGNNFLKLVGLSLMLVSLLPAMAYEGQRPNVLFIVSDDMRPQLGCYGDPVVKTPNIDALAARGLVFQCAFAQQGLCSPSRISFLSGRHPWTTKIYDIGPTLRSTMPDIVTLPQLFKNNGWLALSLGKVFHVGIDDPASWSEPSWHSGLQQCDPDDVAKRKAAEDKFRMAGKPLPKIGPDHPFFAVRSFSSPDCADDALPDGDTANKAVAKLRELAKNPEQPFFLGVGFFNPHHPFVAPKRYYDLYRDEDIHLPANLYPPKNAPAYAARSADDFFWYSNMPHNKVMSEGLEREVLHSYLAAISYVDACVGRILAELDRLDLRKNTIVVFWGDHGLYVGEHNWWGSKHNNYEGATQAPLIVSTPGMKSAGKMTRALVEFVDVFPSLAELAGLPMPDGLEGRSFVPLLDQPDLPWKSAAFSEYPMRSGNGIMQGTAMRTERYRYVEWRDEKGVIQACELYDHETDPQENENIAGNPEHAALLKELSSQMKAVRPL